MSWVQKLSPNLDNDPNDPLYVYIGGELLYDWYGWCLAVIAASFSARGSSYSAKTAWQSCGTKHCDYNLPENVWVPVWWEGGTYGHVAEAYRVGDSITVYSSPYTHKPSFEVFKGNVADTLNYIGRVYGVGGFSGWSETLLDSRVIDWVENKPKPTKSNEEICEEIWQGLWGVGEERKKRLEEAGYDYDTIQKMVDDGVGKPAENSTPSEPVEDGSEPKDDDNIIPEPEPVPEPSDEPTEPIDENNDKKEDEMSEKQPYEPAKEVDQQLVGGLIEEASECFEPSKKVKLIAYLIGDALLVGAVLIPDIVNALNAPTANIWAEYTSKVLLEAGTCILLVFKLIKKKK